MDCIRKILTIFTALFCCLSLFGYDKETNLSVILGYNPVLYSTISESDEVTDLGIYSTDVGFLGVEFSKGLLSVNYSISSLKSHSLGLCFTNDIWIMKTDLIYKQGFTVDKASSATEGEGWESSNQNLEIDNSNYTDFSFEVGYIFTADYVFFHELRYRNLFYQNSILNNGLSLGLALTAFYNYSSLSSSEYFVPEGERSYYDGDSWTFRGDASHFIRMYLTPLVAYKLQSPLYFYAGYKIPLFQFRYCEIDLEKDKTELESSLGNLDYLYILLGIGYTENEYFGSCNVDVRRIRSYYLIDENSQLSYNADFFKIKLKAGIRF